MYLNINNLSIFEGRISTELKSTLVGKDPNNQITKLRFSIAVDRGYTKAKKQQEEAANRPTADFIPFEVLGAKADFIIKFFSKGSAIRIISSFRTFEYPDKEDATKKKFGYVFDVVDASFCLGGSANSNGNNGASNSNVGNGDANTTTADDNDQPYEFY